MQQPHAALALHKIDCNRAPRIQRHLRLVGQGHLANLTSTAVVGLQVLQPQGRVPTTGNAHGQYQARSHRQRRGALPPGVPGRWRGHRIQVTLQAFLFFSGQARRRGGAVLPQRLGLGVGLTVPRFGQQPALERRALGLRRLLVDAAEPLQCSPGLRLGDRR